METIKQQFSKSVMSYITFSLVSIIAVALVTIFISFWVTELADKDAQAINTSGSMRMQTYHIGLALQQADTDKAKIYTEQLDKTWNHTLFIAQRLKNTDDLLSERFNTAYQHWNQQLHPQLLEIINSDSEFDTTNLYHLLEDHVSLTDAVVEQFQKDAENKIRQLRTFQLLGLFATIFVGSLIFHLLKNRVEKPLTLLTVAAQKLGQGDIKQRVDVAEKDELGLLGAVFNQMSDAIESNYQELEKSVEARTEELNTKNITLEFLFKTAEKIINSQQHNLDHQEIIAQLGHVLNVDKLELCLFTPQGEKPYLHLAPIETDNKCAEISCGDCKGQAPFTKLDAVRVSERYPISKEGHQYGVISLTTDINKPLEDWQEQLLRSCADQLAIALYLSSQKEQHRRIAMLDERTVIARELHDSLAQALSYLQIQVTRLQKSHDKEKWDLQQPIIDELREGLSSAYRQLRELLTTFRLKMDSDGLKGALENTVKQLQERTEMVMTLDYQLADIPLSPTEEIHLLQIVREASQNSIHHARGSRVDITLKKREDNKVELTICDDGIGIKSNPEKLNHYGLAIMNERSRHLGGKVNIHPRDEGGTIVEFIFKPDFLRNNNI